MALVILLGGCSASTDTGPPATTESPRSEVSPGESTPSQSSSTTAPENDSTAVDAQTVKEGARVLRQYLNDWIREGAVGAGRHLVPEQRPSQDIPVLTSGRVAHVEVQTWSSSSQFTLLVDLYLHFGSDPFAWNEGHNTRFVTFTRRNSTSAYMLSFTTSP